MLLGDGEGAAVVAMYVKELPPLTSVWQAFAEVRAAERGGGSGKCWMATWIKRQQTFSDNDGS
jgi:hypothetical protein